MKSLSYLLSFVILLTITHLSAAQTPSAAPAFWPEGKRVALSLSFDDARLSQVDVETQLLDEYGVKAAFCVDVEREQTS